jgi:hypothetical protein
MLLGLEKVGDSCDADGAQSCQYPVFGFHRAGHEG